MGGKGKWVWLWLWVCGHVGVWVGECVGEGVGEGVGVGETGVGCAWGLEARWHLKNRRENS